MSKFQCLTQWISVVFFLFFINCGYAASYSYDANSKLQSATQASGETAVYNYDSMGNIVSVSHESIPTPHIDSFAPNFGSVGENVALIGTNFAATTSGNTVDFNGTGAAVLTASSTQLLVQVPVGATTGPITVTTSGGSDTTATNFEVTTYGLPPTITSVTASGGEIGDTITVEGDNLNPITGQTTVLLNGMPITPTTVTNTEVDFALPPYGGVYLVEISTPFGTARNSNNIVGAYPSGYTDSNVETELNLPIPYGSTTSSTKTITMPDAETAAIGIETFSGQWKTINFNFGTNIPYSLSYTVEDKYGNVLLYSTFSPGSNQYYALHLPYLSYAKSSYMVLVTSPETSNSWTVSTSEDAEISANSELDGVTLNNNPNISVRLILDTASGQNYGLGVVEDTTGTSNGFGFTVINPLTGGIINTFGGPIGGYSGESNNTGETSLVGPILGQLPVTANLTSSGTSDTATFKFYLYANKSYSLTSSPVTISNDYIGQDISLNFSTSSNIAYTVAFSSLGFTDIQSNPLDYIQFIYASVISGSTAQGTLEGSSITTTPSVYANQSFNGASSYMYGGNIAIPYPSTPQTLQMIVEPSYAYLMSASASLITQTVPTLTANGSDTILSASVPGQYLYENLTLNAGDIATVSFNNYSLTDLNYHGYTVYIIDPTGNQIKSTSCDTTTNGCTLNIFEAPYTGNYLVKIIPSDSGQWTITSQLSYSNNIVVVSGVSATIHSDFYGQDVFVSFPATAGVPVTLTSTISSISDSTATTYYLVIDPSGNIVGSAPYINNAAQISNTGSVVVNLDVPTTTGTYQLHIYNTIGATFSGTVKARPGVVDNLTVNTAQTLSSTLDSQNNNLFFNGTSGDSYTFQLTDFSTDSFAGEVPVLIFDPTGTLLYYTYCTPSSCTINISTLSITGTYQIIFYNQEFDASNSATVEVTNP